MSHTITLNKMFHKAEIARITAELLKITPIFATPNKCQRTTPTKTRQRPTNQNRWTIITITLLSSYKNRQESMISTNSHYPTTTTHLHSPTRRTITIIKSNMINKSTMKMVITINRTTISITVTTWNSYNNLRDMFMMRVAVV